MRKVSQQGKQKHDEFQKKSENNAYLGFYLGFLSGLLDLVLDSDIGRLFMTGSECHARKTAKFSICESHQRPNFVFTTRPTFVSPSGSCDSSSCTPLLHAMYIIYTTHLGSEITLPGRGREQSRLERAQRERRRSIRDQPSPSAENSMSGPQRFSNSTCDWTTRRAGRASTARSTAGAARPARRVQDGMGCQLEMYFQLCFRYTKSNRCTDTWVSSKSLFLLDQVSISYYLRARRRCIRVGRQCIKVGCLHIMV